MSHRVAEKPASMVTMIGLLIALSASGVDYVAAEPPNPSTTMEAIQPGTRDSGGVQERSIRQVPPGGMTTVPIQSSGFSCDPKTTMCSCRKSTAGDCTLMNAIACKGAMTCPGSSQTCTCTAIVK